MTGLSLEAIDVSQDIEVSLQCVREDSRGMTPAGWYFASSHEFSLKVGVKKICEVQAIPGRGRGKKGNVNGFSRKLNNWKLKMK